MSEGTETLIAFLRRIGRFLEMPDDPGAAKALALLGAAGFGPVCATCGKRDWRGMLPRHYAYVNRLALREHGKPFCKLEGVCQCGPGEQRTFRIGDPVRIKNSAASAYAGREDAWIRGLGEGGCGYYVRVGIADRLWFDTDEIEPRQGVLGL